MIFTKDIEKIILYEKGFYFGNRYTVLVPYNDYGKFLLRNNYEIRKSIYLRIDEMYKVELSDFKLADLKLDDNNYVVIMPLINMETLAKLYYYYNESEDSKNIYIFGLKEYESVIKQYLPKCKYKGLTKEKIDELLLKYKESESEEDEIL